MGFFHNYPYSDLHELNLDWIIAEIKKLHAEWDDFRVLNAISFAGTWNIEKSYKQWSFVDDGNGMGYISIRPVPTGIPLTEEKYWRLVANYSVIFADFQNRIIALETKMTLMPTINIKEFGAICDGINDDTESLQDAINYCSEHSEYILLLVGTILVKHSIVLKDNVKIYGNECEIKVDNANTENVFVLENVENIFIKNVKFTYAGTNDFNCIYARNVKDVFITNCKFYEFVGRALYGDALLNNLIVSNCYAKNCDKIARLNGGGTFNIGNTNNPNNTVSFINCEVYGGGNAGFQLFDMKYCLVKDCFVENVTGGGGNWETGNGFNIGSNVIISNCRVTTASNAGFYVNGGNNLIEGCTVIGTQGFAVDLYTGNTTAYYNTIDGCNFINCATVAHTDLYPNVKIIGGTKQNGLSISDINIKGGGTNTAPANVIEFDELNNSIIDNVNVANVTNVSKGLYIRGSQSFNSIRNSVLQATIEIENYSSSTEIFHCKPLNRAVNSIPSFINSSWQNKTGHDIFVYINGGTITEIALNNVIVASTQGCYFVPNDFILGINGSVAPTIKYIYAD